MAKKKAKPWTVEVHGLRARLYRRQRGGPVYFELRENGSKERRSLNVTDKEVAEAVAREVLEQIDEERRAGRKGAPLTFRTLRRLYERHRAMLLRDTRRKFLERTLDLWQLHLEPEGQPFPIADFGEHQVTSYVEARRAGRLHGADPRATRDGVRDGTIGNEVQALTTVFRWAQGFRRNGRPLLERDPMLNIPKPREANPRRPRASRDRIDRLFGVADRVDPSGQFRMLLRLATSTGRRITAITKLRASDVLIGRDQVRRGLNAIGEDESWAEHWPAAIHWRAENDKAGRDWIAPIAQDLEAELGTYVRRTAAIGDAWLFPYAKRPGEPLPKNAADWLLRQAEKAAEVEHQARGGWHAFRRAWATARKAFPVPDVMKAGGWADPKALTKAYTQADAETVRKVAEGA